MLDQIVFSPRDVDLARSPLRAPLATRVLGAFNPGLTRLANGNLLLMVRVAEALVEPVAGDRIRTLRRDAGATHLDERPLSAVDLRDPRTVALTGQPYPTATLTSLSWLLPVELDPDGRRILALRYEDALVPDGGSARYGLEDPRISQVDGEWLMTVCAVSDERLGTLLYRSPDARRWTNAGLVLDHQNKDMLLFNGRIDGSYWAQTRPLGESWLAPPPGSPYRAGPAIQFATSPDALHWKPLDRPGLRPHAATLSTARMGGGAPPLRLPDGWLSLWHGVEPNGGVGTYRTYWTLLDAHEPWRTVRTEHHALLAPAPALLAEHAAALYLHDVTFTTGAVLADDRLIVASGENDYACRITHVPLERFAGGVTAA